MSVGFRSKEIAENAIGVSGSNGLAQLGFSIERIGRGENIVIGEPQEPVKIGAGDGEAARSQGLVPVVLANGGDGEVDLVVAKLALE